ncbi:MAG TPA: lysine--tRNA ligase [Candidatus Borkfalkia excrementipullorum]|nr:lysine--tRNA ligase [Candidatus Borkfalkia excrementipullorum]
MYWADKLADEVIRRKPDKEEYVCAAGISPSGSVHIGNFRDIATSYFVYRALLKKGKKARLVFSWDEFDRLRKVPKNVSDYLGNNSFEQYIGYPYVDIPDPFGKDESYAAHFEKEFMESIKRFGIEMDYRYQAKEYRSGRYAEHVIFALKNRKKIFDILDKHRTQDATEEERENYYPVSIFCPHCHKDSTKIVSLSDDCTKAHYTCECGHEGDFDFTKDFNCKLQWKVDWPMRWMAEGVDFEPGGKDHASKNGSYDTAKDISREVFGYEPPLFQGYEFIGIKGNVNVGKMSGSSGLNMTPDFLLKLYPPELILWLYAKTEPLKAFDFCLSDEILRQYFEFGKMLTSYMNGTADENTKRIMENSLIEGRKFVPVPMSQLVDLGSVVDFNPEMMEKLFEKIGTPYKIEDFKELFERAKFWLRTCSPESEYVILEKRNWPYWRSMNDKERECVRLLKEYIEKGGYTLDSLQAELYAIPKQVFPDIAEDKNALKAVQSKFFKDVYNLTLARDKGPRLYLYLYAVEPSRYLKLLDFSLPESEDPDAKEEVKEEVKEEKSAPVEDKYVPEAAPFKEVIEIGDFDKCDIRVCKVLSAKPMRKTNKLMKITLHDGAGERVIVSSIADQYEPEQLVGRKIIVLVNLKPHKFGNEYSNGMLLASGNTDGTCRILFAADDAEIGSLVH